MAVINYGEIQAKAAQERQTGKIKQEVNKHRDKRHKNGKNYL